MKRSVQPKGFQDPSPLFVMQSVEAFWSGYHYVLSVLPSEALQSALHQNSKPLQDLHELLPYLRRGAPHVNDSQYYHILQCLRYFLQAIGKDRSDHE